MSQAQTVYNSLLSKNVEPSSANTFLTGFSGAKAMREKYAKEYAQKQASAGGSITNTSVFTPAVMAQHEQNQQAIQTGTLAQQPAYPIPWNKGTTTVHVATNTTSNTKQQTTDVGGGEGGSVVDADDEEDEEIIEDEEDEDPNWFKRESFLNTPNWIWILAVMLCVCCMSAMSVLLILAV
jgi:hypothetical protein